MSTGSRSKALALALACVITGASSTAWSGEIPASGPMTFSAFDRNDDGTVTADEFASARAERTATRSAQGAPMRGAASAPTFDYFDTDGDGLMTAEEFAAGRQARMQGGPGMRRGMGAGMGPGIGMGRNMPSFSDFDLNQDGGLTEEEFYTARTQRMAARAQQGYPMRNAPNAPTFERIDTDASGVVSPEEFAAAQAEHRRQMMQQP